MHSFRVHRRHLCICVLMCVPCVSVGAHTCVCSCEGQTSTSGINHSLGHHLFGVLRQSLWVLQLTYFPRLPGQQVLSSSGITRMHCHSQLFTEELRDITQACMLAWQALYQAISQALDSLLNGTVITASSSHFHLFSYQVPTLIILLHTIHQPQLHS